jgi:hypothetical protein
MRSNDPLIYCLPWVARAFLFAEHWSNGSMDIGTMRSTGLLLYFLQIRVAFYFQSIETLDKWTIGLMGQSGLLFHCSIVFVSPPPPAGGARRRAC